MNKTKEQLEHAAELHRRAETRAQTEQALTQEGLQAMTPEGMSQLFHSLRVHQIELEMQNEELRRARLDLEIAKARYFDLYDLAPVGYCTLDDQGVILEANFSATNLLGTVRNAVVKQKLTRFILEDDQDVYYLHRRRLSETREAQSCELRLVRPDKTSFWAHLDSSDTLDADGAPVYRVVMSDVSERKRAEEEKQRLERHALKSQNMETLGRLAGGVAHDMNNVLGAILGLASANLELQPMDSPAYRAFSTISKAAVRGGNTVKSLLAFARQSPAVEQDLDLNTILQEEVRLLERTTFAKVRLVMDLDPDLRRIRGDASALTLAFMNLCVNAVDAMAANGTIRLCTRNMGDHWVEVIVEDSGCGMSKAVLDKAMDPFFTTKEVGKGTGLGLSMVFSTVEAHRGHMTIQSELGKGTHVELFFPACEALDASTDQVIEPVPEQPRVVLQVLVVDDDELIHSAMQSLLEALGHKVTSVASGEAALGQLEAGLEPDVVLLDMNMPGLGGVGTLPRMRALRPELPVLISTSRVDQSALNFIAAHPFTTLMPKPFTLGQLRKHLEPVVQKVMGHGQVPH